MAPPALPLPHNSVAPAHSCPKLRPVTRTFLLSVLLSVALAVTGCNRKPAAPAEQQPVAEEQRVPREQTPQQASAAQQSSDLLQAPVRPLQAPVPPPEPAASPSQVAASPPGSRRAAAASSSFASASCSATASLNAKQYRVYPDARTAEIARTTSRSVGGSSWTLYPTDRFASVFRHRRIEWGAAGGGRNQRARRRS